MKEKHLFGVLHEHESLQCADWNDRDDADGGEDEDEHHTVDVEQVDRYIERMYDCTCASQDFQFRWQFGEEKNQNIKNRILWRTFGVLWNNNFQRASYIYLTFGSCFFSVCVGGLRWVTRRGITLWIGLWKILFITAYFVDTYYIWPLVTVFTSCRMRIGIY